MIVHIFFSAFQNEIDVFLSRHNPISLTSILRIVNKCSKNVTMQIKSARVVNVDNKICNESGKATSADATSCGGERERERTCLPVLKSKTKCLLFIVEMDVICASNISIYVKRIKYTHLWTTKHAKRRPNQGE